MRGLGSRHYPDEAAVRDRLAVIGKTRRVAAYLTATLTAALTATAGTDAAAGKPTLTWEFDQAALDAEAATDGWYALLANLDHTEAGAAGVLQRFKGQEVSERRYGNYKGPLAVAPLFLKHNRRIEALITVICLALLVFSSSNAKSAPRSHHRPRCPACTPDGPPARRLADLPGPGRDAAHPATGDQPAVIPQPTPLQQRLLDFLEVDPLKPP